MENIIRHSTNGTTEDDLVQGCELLPFYMGYLTPEMVIEARNQLNETELTRTYGLEELRLLIENENNLFTQTDDNFLLAFLRARKFNVRKAFKLLQNFYHLKKDYPKIFYNESEVANAEALLRRNIFGYLRYRDKNGSIVFCFRTDAWDPEIDSMERMLFVINAFAWHTMEDPATQVAGYRMIFDIRGVTWTQLTSGVLPNLNIIAKSLLDCFPGRYKGIYLISDNKFFNILWAILYPLLPFKLKRRIYIVKSDLSPLQDFIDPSILPVVFGGQLASLDNSRNTRIIEYVNGQLLDFMKYGYK